MSIRSRRVWTAKMGCDGYLKRLLLRVIEWQTILRRRGDTEVWHDGRFVDRWAESDVRTRLPDTFAQYDPKDDARGLTATGRLFSDLARELVRRRGWTYPEEAESAVLALVATTLNDLRQLG